MDQPSGQRMVDADALVSTREIAERLGVGVSNVWHWARATTGFPVPVARLGKGGRFQVWSWPDVAKWAVLSGLLDPRQPLPAAESPDVDELLTGKQVAELLGWTSASAAWQGAKRGTFPWPVREERPRLWRRSDVERWSATARRQPSRRTRVG